MSKAKKNPKNKPQQNFDPAELGDIFRRCTIIEREEALDDVYSEDMDEYICEYIDNYAFPNEHEIPQRENYPYRDMSEVRDLLGRKYDALTELTNHVVNDTVISDDNKLINLKREYCTTANLHRTVNRKLDYEDVLEHYVQNLKNDLLDLPEELQKEKTLLIFSFQDMLSAFLNSQAETLRYHEIIEESLIDIVRKLADGKISGDEAKKIARDHEIRLEGFTRLCENVSDGKYMDAALELERYGYPGSDEREPVDEEEG